MEGLVGIDLNRWGKNQAIVRWWRVRMNNKNRSAELTTSKTAPEPKILVMIPAYNEQENIARVIKCIHDYVPKADVIVIDDGSIDATKAMAESAGAQVVSLPFNMGYGVACQTGFKYAFRNGYDYLVQMDGDGQHEPKCIPEMLAAVQNPDVDIVLGSRWLGLVEYKGPMMRKFGKFFFGYLASKITQHNVTDPTTGFQALSRPVILFYCTDVYPVDYPDADVIIMLDRAGFKVKEVPVIMYLNQTGQSMHAGILRPLYYGIKMLMSITMTLLRDDRDLRRQWPSEIVTTTEREVA
jgi:glycosyltransferase involved in cell wall biosynthesis